jgi:hypothetical protein
MLSIPWYFNVDLWRKCKSALAEEHTVSCAQLLLDLTNTCPKDQLETFKTDPVSWTGLLNSFSLTTSPLSKIIENSAIFYGSEAIAYSIAVKDTHAFWHAAFNRNVSEIEFMNSPFHISKAKLLRYEIFDSLINRFGEESVISCAFLDSCYSIFKSLGDECRDRLPNELLSTSNSIPEWFPIFSIKKCFNIHTKTKNGGHFYLKTPIDSGAFSKIFDIEYIKDGISYPAVLKLTKFIKGGILPFSPPTRDIQGMQLIEQVSSIYNPELIKKAKQWLVEFYDIYSPGKEIILGNEVFVSPGIIMEKIEKFEQKQIRNISIENFCMYYSSFEAIKDLYEVNLIHEDFHMGNFMFIKNPPYNRILFNKKTNKFTRRSDEDPDMLLFTESETLEYFQVICPRMKLVDTGSLNTVEGKYSLHGNIVEISQNRKTNLKGFMLQYISAFHSKFMTGGNFSGILSKLAAKIFNDAYDHIKSSF